MTELVVLQPLCYYWSAHEDHKPNFELGDDLAPINRKEIDFNKYALELTFVAKQCFQEKQQEENSDINQTVVNHGLTNGSDSNHHHHEVVLVLEGLTFNVVSVFPDLVAQLLQFCKVLLDQVLCF